MFLWIGKEDLIFALEGIPPNQFESLIGKLISIERLSCFIAQTQITLHSDEINLEDKNSYNNIIDEEVKIAVDVCALKIYYI
jgi:hypothetical protein